MITTTTDENFEADVLNCDKPVLVDFWAEWCGPCKAIAPILDEVAGEYQDKLVVCKMDIDAHNKTPQKYGIRSIPTLLIFKNGSLVDTQLGALNKGQLTAFIDKHLD